MDDLQMQMIFKRDLSAPLLVQTPVTLLKQGDSEANALVIDLYNGSEETDASGYTVSGYLLRADGARVPLEGNVNGRRVTVGLNKHCYLVPGPYGAFVRLTKGEFKRTILEIAGRIESEGSGPVVDTGEKFVTIEEIIEQMDAMKQVTEEASEAAENANAAADDANNAAEAANGAAENANKWANAEVNATSVSAGDQPTVSVTEVNGKKEISFGIPAGITPSITFHVATGEPGTQVEVSQSGTPEAPVVNLTIPRGNTGAVDGFDYYSGNPSALGEGSPGTSNEVARGDHVHPIPSASDVGALLAGGTAADSAKLGGKAPEYYIQPRNLLDNSDFTNPVNQRGQTSYTAAGYTIDRWEYQSGEPKAVSIVSNGVNVSAIDTTSTARLIQKQASLKEGVYTFAAMVNGSIKVRVVSWTAGAFTTLNNENASYTGGYLEVGVRNAYPAFNLLVNAGYEVVFEWVALYEGQYTAETLPPYVPKGYSVELAECQRYFQMIAPGYLRLGYGCVSNTTETETRYSIPIPNPMRTKPTITFDDITAWRAAMGSTIKTPSEVVFTAYSGNSGVMVVCVRFESEWGNTGTTFLYATQGENYIRFNADL